MKNKFLKIALFFIIIFIIIFLTLKKPDSRNVQKLDKSTENIPFKIEKQIFYSGITPKSTSFYDSDWNLSISQYTDIAIYLSNDSNTLTEENTISSLYIDNIKYIKKPKIGTPSLYYQNPLKFATDTIYTDYLIDNHLSYNILNFENKENYNYYSTPNFFTDCSLPITLKYVNSNILNNYKLSNTETLLFDGKILKNSKINISDLDTTISFCINIVSNNDILYKYNMNIDIPLYNTDYNLFDSNIYVEKNITDNFYVEK